MKTKRFGMVLVFVLAMVLFPVGGFPKISSRIQGTVVDNVTGEPVIGAKIVLFYSYNYSSRFEEKWIGYTDSKGSFKVDMLDKGYYFIGVYKEGYADFGPFFESEYIAEKKEIFGGGFIVRNTFAHEKIILEEGMIKHAQIRLKKEAVIEIHFNRKTPKGIEPLLPVRPNCKSQDCPWTFYATLDWYENNFVLQKSLRPSKKDIGYVLFNRLPGGDTVHLEILAMGYPKKIMKIILEEGKTLVIDQLLDFTTGQVIHGVMKDRTTQQPLKGVYISVRSTETENSTSIRTSTDKNGEYWLGGFRPGKCRMTILTQKGEIISLEYQVRENQILEVNKEL